MSKSAPGINGVPESATLTARAAPQIVEALEHRSHFIDAWLSMIYAETE